MVKLAGTLIDNDELFQSSRSTDVTLDGLTITGGRSISGAGGAMNAGGDLTIIDSDISGNIADYGGGGVSGGGSYLTIMNSAINGEMPTRCAPLSESPSMVFPTAPVKNATRAGARNAVALPESA